MFEALSGIFASSGLGAIVGAVGNWLGKIEERKLKRLEFEHETKMRHQDMQQMRLEQTHALDMVDKQIDKAETEGQIATDLKEVDGWAASIKQAAVSTGVAWVDAVRGLMRPLITVYLLIVASVVAYQVNALVGGLDALPMAELVDLYRSTINQLIFLATVAVTWWFGSRPQGQAGRK